jgi:hypothetical protein
MCQLCLICLRYSTSDNHNSSVMNTIPHGDNDDAILNSVLANHREERHLSPSIHMVSHKILLLHRLRNKWLKRQCMQQMQQMAESLRAWTAVSVVQGSPHPGDWKGAGGTSILLALICRRNTTS